MLKISCIIFLFLLFLPSCTKKIEFESIDIVAWKKDKMGCEDYRKSVIENLFDEKSKIIGLSPADINRLLGQPNENEPYKRNQRFFVYYTGLGSQCNDQLVQAPPSLNIRFDAIDRANEVYLNR